MKKQENKITAGDIDATLTYGQIFASRAMKSAIIFLYILSGILFVLILLLLIPIILGYMDNNMKASLIGGSIMCPILILTTVLIHCVYSSGKKKVELCLKDSVLIGAYVKTVGNGIAIRNMMALHTTAIEVSFGYDGKRYTRQSTYKDKPLYLAVYTKYAEQRNILIAYSPKYDEVMLIKPKSAERLRENL